MAHSSIGSSGPDKSPRLTTMLWRLFNFVAIQLAGALLGGALAEWLFGGKYMSAGGLLGAFVAAAIWLSLDLARGERVLRWLQGGDVLEKSARFGLWGEVAARARKLIESREQEKDLARAQLKAFPCRHPGLAQRRDDPR